MEESPKGPNQTEKKAFTTKEPLTFEEFRSLRSSGGRIYNSFPALFYEEAPLAKILREQTFFKKFQEENSELEKSLTEKLSELSEKGQTSKFPEDIVKNLYKAYLIMLSYDEIKTSNDLFI